MKQMKVYLGWSGEQSRKLAQLFREHLPAIVQVCEPFYSDEDIRQGKNWQSEIGLQLAKCKVGILFVTPDATLSPWLHFEAGALAKTIEESHVMPLLFGLKVNQLGFPLAQFQASEFSKEGVLKIVETINNTLQEPLAGSILKRAFEGQWDSLQNEVDKIFELGTDGPIRPTAEDQLGEIVGMTRAIYSRLDNLRTFESAMWPFHPNQSVYYGGTEIVKVTNCRKIEDGDWLINYESKKQGKRFTLLSIGNLKNEEYDPFADE